jgi:dihydroorotase
MPHTLEEKSNKYLQGLQWWISWCNMLTAMLQFVHDERIIEKVVQKINAIPDPFDIPNRGYIREGYKADLGNCDTNNPWTVTKSNILGSVMVLFEGVTFKSRITHTLVNGHLSSSESPGS